MKISLKIISVVYSFLVAAVSASALQINSVAEEKAPFTDLGDLIGQVFVIVLVLGGILFFIYLLIGGLQWVTSGGDKASLESARGKITAALTGLIIILATFALTKVIEAAFGIRVLSGIGIPSAPNDPLAP